MKSTSKTLGVLLTAATLTTMTLKADDKPAATTPAAPAKAADGKLDETLFPDPVIAKGKGFEIKRSRLDEAVSGFRANALRQGRELLPSDLPIIEKNALEQLLQVEVLKQGATDADKAKAKELTDKRIDAIKKRAPSEEALAKQLKSMNLTLDDLRARLLEEGIAQQVLRDKVNVTDEQLKKYYADNPSQFEEPESATASHILISTLDKTGAPLSDAELKAKRKIAEDLLKRARGTAGAPAEDFGKLAKQYSEDPGVKENGGEYKFHKGQMVPEFEAAAFSLQTNQISDLVQSKYGFHIIKLTEKNPARKMEFDKVSPEIRNYLESMEMEKVLPDVYAKLKKDANIVIVDDQLKTLMESSADAGPGFPKAAPAPTTVK